MPLAGAQEQYCDKWEAREAGAGCFRLGPGCIWLKEALLPSMLKKLTQVCVS